MEQNYRVWKLIPAVIGLYHMAVGTVLMFSGELAIRLAKTFGGMTVVGSPAMGILGEILACYVLAFGAMMLVAAWDPVKNRACLSIGVILFALRVLQRALFGGKLMDAFQMNAGHYWGTLMTVGVLGLGLTALRWRIYRDMHRVV